MSRFYVIAYTTEPPCATKHDTIADAKKAANARTGRYGQWTQTRLVHTTVWEKGQDRDLCAIVLSAAEGNRNAVCDAFGVDPAILQSALS